MDGGVLLGIAFVVALGAAGAVVLRLLLSSPVIIGWCADVGLPGLRRCLGLAPRRFSPVVPLTRPIQEIGARVRRLGGEYHGGHPGRSWVKSEALRRAYDEALDEACRALEVPTDLLVLEPGTGRDFERVRVERVLVTAGLVMPQRPAA